MSWSMYSKGNKSSNDRVIQRIVKDMLARWSEHRKGKQEKVNSSAMVLTTKPFSVIPTYTMHGYEGL